MAPEHAPAGGEEIDELEAEAALAGRAVRVIGDDGAGGAGILAGRDAEVLQLRRTFQETMRLDLVAAVERLTAGKVQAFMSANHIAPDTAAEIFLMDRDVGVGNGRTRPRQSRAPAGRT